ncbi:hypothetical protein MKW94_027489 [Papaver nudicaule]|uniref:F-box domain-containing protein n=1 Tax=Papaver nudicaule TaxID=74823 RepID=A0AA41VJQ4_PAPNU|nr:hypothetical protein [Papaver nudicaule]
MGGDFVLPEDLLIEILLWLPVVSLLRFKTVCKSWRATIESSDFIHRHATFENSSDNLGNFIFQSRHGPFFFNFKPHFFSLSPSSRGERQWVYKHIGVPPHLAQAEVEAEAEEMSPEELPFKVKMVGSCHGIICLHEVQPRSIVLWNPATKKFRRLPKSLPLPNDPKLQFSFDYVGFGFDIETNDYKVFQCTSFKSDSDHLKKTSVQVYSSQSNSWRWCIYDLPTFPKNTFRTNVGRYLNGSYYLFGNNFYPKQIIIDSELFNYTDSEQVILSFDFNKESFRMIPAPAPMPNRLHVIGGNHGKIVCVRLDYPSYIHEMYELNDFKYRSSATTAENNENLWSKIYTTTRVRDSDSNGPMEITKNAVFGFVGGFPNGGLILLNLRTEEIIDIEIIDTSLEGVALFETEVYKETLVSV